MAFSRLVFALVGSVASERQITVGSPGVSFHQSANWVVVRGLERLGYTVTVMDQQPHRDMYPRFVAGEIDVVTGSDLPYNHATWLWNHTDQFFVMGTVNEATDILLGVPTYAGATKVSEFLDAKDDFHNEVLSLSTANCPICVKQGQDLADSLGWSLRELEPEEFQSEVAERISKQEKFVVSWYNPSYVQALVTGMQNLKGDVEPWTRHNIGKTICRFDSADKLTTEARNFLAAAFLGNDDIQQMDIKINIDGMEPKAAADAWIEENQRTFDSFFGTLHDPDANQFVVV